MNKYVVTGGAGFIGSSLVRGLLASGASRVTVVDNLHTGREENLEEVRASMDLERTDIRNYADLAAILHEGRVQQIGPIEELLRRPNSEFVARFVRTENIFSGHACPAAAESQRTVGR